VIGLNWVGAIVFASLFAGVVSVDRAAFGQFQISRPLVAAPLLGLLMGIPTVGVVTGLVFELLFLDSLPVGSFVPFEPLFPALLSVVLVGTGQVPPSALPMALVISLPSMVADQWAEVRWRRSNEHVFNRAQACVRLGRVDLAQIQMGFAIFLTAFFHFTAFLFSCAILVPAGRVLAVILPDLSGFFLVAALVPLLTGLSAFSRSRLHKKEGWIQFAAGLFFGLLAGLV